MEFKAFSQLSYNVPPSTLPCNLNMISYSNIYDKMYPQKGMLLFEFIIHGLCLCFLQRLLENSATNRPYQVPCRHS